MPRRRSAREVVFQVLYRDDLNPSGADPTADRALLASRLVSPSLVEFAAAILAGVHQHWAGLDQVIGEAAQNWELHRMAATDRALLRLGAWEILHWDTPDAVVVNEVVDLAKRYGTAQSAAFVNGILDCLLHEKQETTDNQADP